MQVAPDIIHIHELRTVENLLALRVKPRVPVFLSPHGTLPYGTGRGGFKRWWDRLFGRYLGKRISHILALTETEQAEVIALWKTLGVPIPPISVIPNGIDPDLPDRIAAAPTLRERYGLGDGPVVLFVGRLHERKGLQCLIPAFAQAAADQPDARLLIVGPDSGMLPSAQRLAQNCGISDRVIFTGLLQGQDLHAALATGDLFVLPAVGEGLSMAVLEGMAAGLPLILTPGCNMPRLDSQGAGMTVPRETDALSLALRTLLTDPDRRKAMGQRARLWATSEFTWPVIANRTIAIYQRSDKMI